MKPKIMDIPLAEYLADPAPAPSLSRSLIVKLLAETPYAAWWEHPKLNPRPPEEDGNRATDMGTAAHAWLLEGKRVFQVLDFPDYRTKAAKEERDAARAAGRTPILADALKDLKGMVEKAQETLKDAGWDLAQGRAEQTILWHSGACWLRTRPDWNDGKRILEYKTTELSPAAWIHAIATKGYDIQAWMHREGVAAAHQGESRAVEVTFAVQNVNPPYSMFFARLSPLYYELAERKVARATGIWARCLETGSWPEYSAEPQIVEPSNWQLAADEEAEIAQQEWSEEAFLFGKVEDVKK